MWHCHVPTAKTVIDMPRHQVESAVGASTTSVESDMREEEEEEEVSTLATSAIADVDMDWGSKEAVDKTERK